MSYTPTNFFSGSPLNRLSWLRPSHKFLNAVITSPNTRWLLFKAGQPLLTSPQSTAEAKSTKKLAYLPTRIVLPILGPSPYFGQSQKPGELLSQSDITQSTEAARHLGIPVVFLGLHETGTGSALPETEFKEDVESIVNKLEGTPYFAVDVGDLEESQIDGVLKTVEKEENVKLEWGEPRSAMGSMDGFEAAVYAEARSMVDWNFRSKFCAGCGAPQYSMWGGWKLSCTRLLPWGDNSSEGRKPCPSGKGLNNYTHPRTDAVVIMIAIDHTGEKILLGRNARRKFPLKFYSALAGFIEPGEAFEDAVKREMWEEAGVRVWDVTYHSAQPWPYPANLMVGYYARADSTKPIRTDLDNELMGGTPEAKFYRSSANQTGTKLDFKRFAQKEKADEQEQSASLQKQQERWRQQLQQNPGEGAGALAHSDPSIVANAAVAPPKLNDGVVENVQEGEPPFRVPPATAIAGMLIRDWAERKIGFPPITPANL
ncbi:nad+ diphosphatase [Moniliophthora roreri]|nr:nad+ diphosphatase [Moniliophthora roreri]